MPDPNHERTHRLITKGYPLDLLPTEEELECVDEMASCVCPRRYCWHWNWINHAWDKSIAEGCGANRTGTNIHGRRIDPSHTTPCKRLDPSSTKDHFEPREPSMIEDGIPEGRWDCADFKQRRSSGPESGYPDVINWNGKAYYISNRMNFINFLEAFSKDLASETNNTELPSIANFLETMQTWLHEADRAPHLTPGSFSHQMDKNPWAALAAMLCASAIDK